MPSTVVSTIDYDADTRLLHVVFLSGAAYHYENVTAEEYAALRAARSKGAFLNRHIKGKHPFLRVDGGKENLLDL